MLLLLLFSQVVSPLQSHLLICKMNIRRPCRVAIDLCESPEPSAWGSAASCPHPHHRSFQSTGDDELRPPWLALLPRLKCLLPEKRHQPVVLLNINIKYYFTGSRDDRIHGHLGLMSCSHSYMDQEGCCRDLWLLGCQTLSFSCSTLGASGQSALSVFR